MLGYGGIYAAMFIDVDDLLSDTRRSMQKRLISCLISWTNIQGVQKLVLLFGRLISQLYGTVG